LNTKNLTHSSENFKLFLSEPYSLCKKGNNFVYDEVDMSLKNNELSAKVKLWIKEKQLEDDLFRVIRIDRLDFQERLSFKITYKQNPLNEGKEI